MCRSLIVAAFLLLAPPLLAPLPAAAQQPIDDEVVLQLSAEGWVQAKAATLRLTVEAALAEDQAASLRGRLDETLRAVATGAPWRILGVDRRADSTGLTIWRVRAEAKVDDATAARAAGLVTPLSKPGFAVRLAGIDYSPDLAEMQGLESELRRQIYAAANEELQRLRVSQPGRSFRLRRVEFQPGAMPAPMPKLMRAEAMAAAPAADAAMPEPAPLAVSRHLVVTATVVLGALPPEQ